MDYKISEKIMTCIALCIIGFLTGYCIASEYMILCVA